jgi:hypothetical protein|tara:strand:+ start:65 stop:370 length:306 start_codon:yes stop_codon:yes gene_type:complete
MEKTMTEQKKPTLASTLGPNNTIEKNIPDDVVWIDDAFYIKKTRFGLYTSILKEPLGAHFLTGGTEDGVIKMSRWHLKCLQDGTLQDYSRVINSGVVGGKL